MATRRGLGKGTGKGYRNLQGRDPLVHRMSAKGIKQPQKIGFIVSSSRKKEGVFTKTLPEAKKEMQKQMFKGKAKESGISELNKPKEYKTIIDREDMVEWRKLKKGFVFVEDYNDPRKTKSIKILFPNNAFTSTSNYVVRIEENNKTIRQEFKNKKDAFIFANNQMYQ